MGGPDDDRGAVGHDFSQLLVDLGGVEAHRDDRVRAEQQRVFDHAVDGVAAGVLEQLGVLRHLALAQRGEPGAERLGETHAADDDAEGQPEVALDDRARQPEAGRDGKPGGRRGRL